MIQEFMDEVLLEETRLRDSGVLPVASMDVSGSHRPTNSNFTRKQRLAKSGLIGITLFGCLFFWLRLGGHFLVCFS